MEMLIYLLFPMGVTIETSQSGSDEDVPDTTQKTKIDTKDASILNPYTGAYERHRGIRVDEVQLVSEVARNRLENLSRAPGNKNITLGEISHPDLMEVLKGIE